MNSNHSTNNNCNNSLFQTFQDLLNTSQCFKNNNNAYFTIKKYTFDIMNYYISNKISYFNNLQENNEYERQLNIYNTELNNYNGYSLIYDKNSYENFVVEAFKPINFESNQPNQKQTLTIAINLLNVLRLYGNLSEQFSNQLSYLQQKLNYLDMNNNFNSAINLNNNNAPKLNNVNSNQSNNINGVNNIINSNSKLSEFINASNKIQETINNNNNNEKINNKVVIHEVKDTKTKGISKKSKEEAIDRKDNPYMPNDNIMIGYNNNGTISFNSLVNRSIKFPISKGTMEDKYIRQLIKEHLMHSEQEALYNKINNSKAHLETAIYYLENLNK